MREFGSEFHALSLPENFFESFTQKFVDYVYLRSGRESLGYVAENIESGRKVILIPAYHCESMVKPFTQRGWTVYFYALKNNLSIDISSLSQMIREFCPSTVLTMNYFGISPTDEAIHFIKKSWQDIIVIEDFTHCAFSLNRIYNRSVDYYIASIRKWLGIFDGALVLSTKILENKPGFRYNKFIDLRQKAQKEKADYLITGDAATKEHFRKTLSKAEQALNDYASINCISPNSMKLLYNVNVPDLIFRRKQNMLHLLSGLKSESSLIFLDNIDDAALGCPFSLPVLLRKRDLRQKIFASKGLYTQVLWPIEKASRMICDNSANMADNMLALPIDQRYDFCDMEDIIRIVKESL